MFIFIIIIHLSAAALQDRRSLRRRNEYLSLTERGVGRLAAAEGEAYQAGSPSSASCRRIGVFEKVMGVLGLGVCSILRQGCSAGKTTLDPFKRQVGPRIGKGRAGQDNGRMRRAVAMVFGPSNPPVTPKRIHFAISPFSLVEGGGQQSVQAYACPGFLDRFLDRSQHCLDVYLLLSLKCVELTLEEMHQGRCAARALQHCLSDRCTARSWLPRQSRPISLSQPVRIILMSWMKCAGTTTM
ncbi:hypothetical protein LX36DRAFT_200557 [Colletotrichum falcatum]|nr:hypothetical protein LX36DRAFT_200557 [Colletotrichum falcatum]